MAVQHWDKGKAQTRNNEGDDLSLEAVCASPEWNAENCHVTSLLVSYEEGFFLLKLFLPCWWGSIGITNPLDQINEQFSCAQAATFSGLSFGCWACSSVRALWRLLLHKGWTVEGRPRELTVTGWIAKRSQRCVGIFIQAAMSQTETTGVCVHFREQKCFHTLKKNKMSCPLTLVSLFNTSVCPVCNNPPRAAFARQRLVFQV